MRALGRGLAPAALLSTCAISATLSSTSPPSPQPNSESASVGAAPAVYRSGGSIHLRPAPGGAVRIGGGLEVVGERLFINGTDVAEELSQVTQSRVAARGIFDQIETEIAAAPGFQPRGNGDRRAARDRMAGHSDGVDHEHLDYLLAAAQSAPRQHSNPQELRPALPRQDRALRGGAATASIRAAKGGHLEVTPLSGGVVRAMGPVEVTGSLKVRPAGGGQRDIGAELVLCNASVAALANRAEKLRSDWASITSHPCDDNRRNACDKDFADCLKEMPEGASEPGGPASEGDSIVSVPAELGGGHVYWCRCHDGYTLQSIASFRCTYLTTTLTTTATTTVTTTTSPTSTKTSTGSTTPSSTGTSTPTTTLVPVYKSCADAISQNKGLPSGFYALRGPADAKYWAYCDMTFKGGGWTHAATLAMGQKDGVNTWYYNNCGAQKNGDLVGLHKFAEYRQSSVDMLKDTFSKDYKNTAYSTIKGNQILWRGGESPKDGRVDGGKWVVINVGAGGRPALTIAEAQSASSYNYDMGPKFSGNCGNCGIVTSCLATAGSSTSGKRNCGFAFPYCCQTSYGCWGINSNRRSGSELGSAPLGVYSTMWIRE